MEMGSESAAVPGGDLPGGQLRLPHMDWRTVMFIVTIQPKRRIA
jgi:hypothetical protein